MHLRFSKSTGIGIMIFLTGVVFIVELVVGYATGSLALVSDSFHMITDFISLVIAAIAVRFATKTPKDSRLTFGWQRSEILAAFANSVFLLALTFIIFINSIERFIIPEHVEKPLLVMIVGVVGLVVNALGLVLFHQHGHSHAHNHDEDDVSSEHEHRSLNIHGVFLHVLGDFLGSLGVIFSALCVYFAPDSNWSAYMDPLASMIMSIIIISTTIPLVRETTAILLQASRVDVATLKSSIETIPGVVSVHELHVWELSDQKTVASVHVLMENNMDMDHSDTDEMVKDGRQAYLAVCTQIKELLHGYGVHSTTIQPEFQQPRSSTPPNSCLMPCRGKASGVNVEGEGECIQRRCCTT